MNAGPARPLAETRRFACGAAIRAWPYLSAVALVGGTVAAVVHVGRRAVELPGWSTARVLVLLVAGAAAFGLVRLGGELQWRVGVDRDRLVFERGARRRSLPFEVIEQLGWQPAGSSRRALFSGTTLDDRQGAVWRLPGVIRDGGGLIDALVDACAREDVSTWCDALQLRRRMGRVALRVVSAYAALAAWIVAVALFVGA